MDDTNETTIPAPPQYSDQFNDEHAEVIYESCDGVRFRIHAIYLKVHTEGLTPPEGSSLKEVVQLTEAAAILELLFKFIYPTRPPLLDDEIGFEIVKDLAEAAEKYQVFPAMYACHLRMDESLPEHAVHVLAYALKHDYVELMDKAAPYIIDVRLTEVFDAIPSEFHKPWLTYYEKWLDVQKRALTTHLPQSLIGSPVSSLASQLSGFKNPETIVATYNNWTTRLHNEYEYEDRISSTVPADWASSIRRDVQEIPKMSEMLCISGFRVDADTNDAGDGSVVIEASDGPLHYINEVALQVCSTGFDTSLGSSIKVPEKSSTLRLLFSFIKPVRLPDLRNLPFDELKDLAYAAEKYHICSATGVCRVFMRKTLPNNPSDVFQYGATFHYLDILDAAAPSVLGITESFETVIKQLPPTLVLPWARYYHSWEAVAKEVLSEVIALESSLSRDLLSSTFATHRQKADGRAGGPHEH